MISPYFMYGNLGVSLLEKKMYYEDKPIINKQEKAMFKIEDNKKKTGKYLKN